eukprot:5629833-Prymnesium_polylepis.1
MRHMRKCTGASSPSDVIGRRTEPRPRLRRPSPGLWPMVRRKAVLGRYAVLRYLWHEVRDDERSNR